MGRVVDELVTAVSMEGLGQWTSGIDSMARALGLHDAAIGASGKKMLTWGLISGGAALAIGAGLVDAAAKAGELEQIRIGLESVTGSAEAAQATLLRLQDFADVSPFQTAGAAQAAQQLLAVRLSAEQTFGAMKALGDALSGVGKTSTADFEDLAGAISKIKAKGKIDMEMVEPFIARGIPVMEILQQKLGLTKKQIQDLGSAGIDADRAIQALTSGLEERFAGAMEKQSKTLNGSLSTLSDAWTRFEAGIGASELGPVTGLVRGLSGVLDAANKLPESTKGMIAPAALLAMAALGGYAAWTGWQLLKMTKETVELANAHMKAAAAARTQAVAEGELAGALAAEGAAAEGAVAGQAAKRGLLGRAGGALKGKGLGLGAALAADVAIGMIPEPKGSTMAGDAIGLGKHAAQGALTGYQMGGGTGAVVGFALGGALAAYENISSAKSGYTGSAEYEEMKRKIKGDFTYKPTGGGTSPTDGKLDVIAGLLKEIRDGKGMPFSTSDIPGRRQMAVLRRAVDA